jgi:hypothetical protein
VSRGSRALLACAVLVLVAHWALGRWLAGVDFMGALADARHGHFAAAAVAIVFVAIRLVTLVLLPALLVAQAGSALFARLVARPDSPPSARRS